jgi:hypothetical protein
LKPLPDNNKKKKKTYASKNASSIARAHWGVEGACFRIIELPMAKVGKADLKAIQKGKFQGKITKITIMRGELCLLRQGPRGCWTILAEFPLLS